MNKQGEGEGYRPTKQARSARSEQLLLDAAESLFAENGYQGTKVADIIERAGCSTGTFYHRFGDKDGLAKVLIQRFVIDASAIADAVDLSRVTHGGLRQMFEHLAGVIFDIMTSRIGVYRAAQRLTTNSGEVRNGIDALVGRINRRVLTHLDDYADEISAPEPGPALSHALQLVIMVSLQTRLGAGILFPRERDALIETMVRAALGLLKYEATT